jgi:hypothetical protein
VTAEVIVFPDAAILHLAEKVSAYVQDPDSPPAVVAEVRDVLRGVWDAERWRVYADGYEDGAGGTVTPSVPGVRRRRPRPDYLTPVS